MSQSSLCIRTASTQKVKTTRFGYQRGELSYLSNKFQFQFHRKFSDFNIQITAANRSDCEDKCLNEFSFVCRSANFDSSLRSCSLSRFTRRTHPELLEDDPNSDYLENTCLNGKQRIDSIDSFAHLNHCICFHNS